MTGFFEYDLKDNICNRAGGRAIATPIYISTPTSIATPTFIAMPTKFLACFSELLHTHPSIDQESAFWGFKGDQDFVGVALRA